MTDSLTSPIALKATEVLIAPNGGNFSPVGAITLCNCFITSLGRLNAQQTLERMELQDKIALEHHISLWPSDSAPYSSGIFAPSGRSRPTEGAGI